MGNVERRDILSVSEVRNWAPDPRPRPGCRCAAARAARRGARGLFRPGQQMGERWPLACVAREITQRRNLDCTLCYLSEHSEVVHDLPLEAIWRRMDNIREHYGTGIDVQVTGGDPTSRPRDELIAIVRRLREQG
ncbi:MAG: hypothetical protein ACI8PT_002078 [Gammaproteobacteria bacterium]|jgi:hypothetical protein